MDALYEAISGWRQPLALGLLFALLCWESATPFFGFFRAKHRDRVRHLLRNISLGLINTVVVAAIFIVLWASLTHWTNDNGWGLLNLFPLPSWLHLLGALLSSISGPTGGTASTMKFPSYGASTRCTIQTQGWMLQRRTGFT